MSPCRTTRPSRTAQVRSRLYGILALSCSECVFDVSEFGEGVYEKINCLVETRQIGFGKFPEVFSDVCVQDRVNVGIAYSLLRTDAERTNKHVSFRQRVECLAK